MTTLALTPEQLAEQHVPGPPEPRPLHATHHCRHYSYRHTGLAGARRGDPSGPRCAVGCDLSTPGACSTCLPPLFRGNRSCDRREEYTEEERATWEAWVRQHLRRAVVASAAIPRQGDGGEVPCPACGAGTIFWSRARRNGHLHAACTTPLCFKVMS